MIKESTFNKFRMTTLSILLYTSFFLSFIFSRSFSHSFSLDLSPPSLSVSDPELRWRDAEVQTGSTDGGDDHGRDLELRWRDAKVQTGNAYGGDNHGVQGQHVRVHDE